MTVECIALYRFSVYFEDTEATTVQLVKLWCLVIKTLLALAYEFISCAFAVKITVPISKEFYQELFFFI